MGTPDPHEALRALLDHEHAVLLSARLSDIAAITDQKEQLLAQLAAAPKPAGHSAVAQLRGQAKRNAELLSAVRRGLTAARTRIGHIRAGGAGLKTYDRQGQSSPLNSSSGAVLRRA